MTCGGGGCEESGSSPKRVSKSAVLEGEDTGLGTSVTGGAAFVRGALLGEDALVLAAASRVSWAHGGAGVGRVARLYGVGIERHSGVGLSVAITDDCNAVIKVVHAVSTRKVLVPARAAPNKQKKREKTLAMRVDRAG
jgi:hypothetical protein